MTQTSNIKETVNQQFSQVAANYTTSAVHAKGEDLPEMVRHAALRGDETVLDAGCGAGHTALIFAPHVSHVAAVDLSDAMLEECRTTAAARDITNIDFRVGDVENLDFADRSFDLVVSRYSAHHWPHPQLALAEFARVLRPGGKLILSDVVSFDDFTIDTHVQAIELLRDTSHVRDHPANQWLAMMDSAGFGAEVVFNWSLYLDFTTWVERMRTPAENVAMMRQLFDGAPAEVRSALRVEKDHSFCFECAILRGTVG